MANHETSGHWTRDLRCRVGVLVFAVVLALGAGCAAWALAQLQADGSHAAQRDAHAMAQSVAQTLAQQLERAVRLGIPLSELPGLTPYLQATLKDQPMLTAIAVILPDGRTLQSAGLAIEARPGDRVSVQIAGQGAPAGAVLVSASGSASMQGSLAHARWLAAIAVLASALGASLPAALWAGTQLERERRAVEALLAGEPLSAVGTGVITRVAPGPQAVLQAFADKEAELEGARQQLAAYAQELLAIDFDGSKGVAIERIRQDASMSEKHG